MTKRKYTSRTKKVTIDQSKYLEKIEKEAKVEVVKAVAIAPDRHIIELEVKNPPVPPPSPRAPKQTWAQWFKKIW